MIVIVIVTCVYIVFAFRVFILYIVVLVGLILHAYTLYFELHRVELDRWLFMCLVSMQR